MSAPAEPKPTAAPALSPRQDDAQETTGLNATSTTDLSVSFQKLAAQWRQERGPFSTSKRLAAHPAYQAIIALGTAVVPFILADLERQPDHWFLALEAITRARPEIPESDRGKLPRMAAAWIAWGRAQGYQW